MDKNLRELMAQREKDLRFVQALVGALVGAGAGVLIVLQLYRATWQIHLSVLIPFGIVLVCSALGALVGYHTEPWRSSLD